MYVSSVYCSKESVAQKCLRNTVFLRVAITPFTVQYLMQLNISLHLQVSKKYEVRSYLGKHTTRHSHSLRDINIIQQ